MADGVAAVVAALEGGDVVVVPTDTVYGLGARLDRPGAIESIFQIKGRGRDKPLPVLGASLQDLEPIARLSPHARALGEAFWPGPLTVVVQRAPDFDVDLGGGPGDRTIAVRVPASAPLLQVLRQAGPLAVTSANISGAPPASSLEEARRSLGDVVVAYLDGGPAGGTPSTVISLVDGFAVLREGALSPDHIRAALPDPG